MNENRKQKHDLKLQKKQEKYENELKEVALESDFKKKKSKLLWETYTKSLVAIIVGVSLFDVQLGYYLCYKNGYSPESITTTMITAILGVAAIYIIRAYFDTKAEHNEKNGIVNKSLTDKILDKAVDAKLSSALLNADMSVDIEGIKQEEKMQQENSEMVNCSDTVFNQDIISEGEPIIDSQEEIKN